MKESSSPAWQVDLQCPQCGASVVIEETDRLFSCAFCRVRLCLHQEDPFCYYLPPRQKPLEDVIFAPYWRFKGMLFALEREAVAARFVDSNVLALRSAPFPGSLGVRPQVLRLKHLTPATEGEFLHLDFPFQEFSLPFGALPGTSCRALGMRRTPARVFIGEMVSVIYAPFHLNGGVLFDAILERPVGQFPDCAVDPLPPAKNPAGSVQFLPMICPTCGWDLEGENNAVVLLCRNCVSAWQATPGGRLEQVACAFLPGFEGVSIYLPCWRIRAAIPGARLKSSADLVRLANLPRAIQRQWEHELPVFWIPAFKIQPQLFLRLAQRFTTAPPVQEGEATIARSPLHAVMLPLSEAVESIRIVMGALGTRRVVLSAGISEMQINVEEYGLVYVPFTLKGSELIQPDMQLSISANALNWGKLL